MANVIKELNRMAFGRKMTKKELALLRVLQKKVKNKEITVKQAQEFWKDKVK